jgi:hypothetical protein
MSQSGCVNTRGGGGSMISGENCLTDINLKVPSHQIRLGLICYGWIGLYEYILSP